MDKKILPRFRSAARRLLVLLAAVLIAEESVYGMALRVNPLTIFVATVLLIAAFRCFYGKPQSRATKVVAVLFSAFLSLANLVSLHIIAGEGILRLAEFEVTDFNLRDLSAFLGMFFFFGALFLAAEELIRNKARPAEEAYGGSERTGIRNFRLMFLSALVIFLCWLPWFLTYYPGLVYGDSFASIAQVLGEPLNNHHPLMYTLLIGLCLQIAEWFGWTNVGGVAIYTVIQMVTISLLLGYTVSWMRNKGVSRTALGLTVLFFGLCGAFPTHAISMWKDPVFSVLLMILGLKLFDVIRSRGKAFRSVGFLCQYTLLCLLLCFLRNNGVYVVLASFVLLLILMAIRKIRVLWRSVIATVLVAVFTIVITGPVYSACGIGADPVEKVGIPLQQMAMVVVENGTMDSLEKEYLNNLLPLSRYKKVYTPGLVDSIKWDEKFNDTYFREHQSEFWGVYLSLFLKNPLLYAKAWVLMTYGFWAPNQWELNNFPDNVYYGNLDVEGFGIRNGAQNLLDWLGFDTAEFLDLASPSPAEGLVFWGSLLLALLWLLHKDGAFPALLLPCLGNLATLLIASPVNYWPRYAFGWIFLLPVLLALSLTYRKQPSPRIAARPAIKK